MAAVTPEDIINRGLQHLGATRIVSVLDNSKNAAEGSFVYDKCRRAELRTNLWNCTARRCILRPYLPGVSMVWNLPEYSSSITYGQGALVNNGDIPWVSVQNSNLNNQVGAGPPFEFWDELSIPALINPYVPGATYYPGEVTCLDATSHLFITAVQTTAAPGPYMTPPNYPWVDTGVAAGINGATVITPYIPLLTSTTGTLATPKTAYPLPAGYIRVMPQDPKRQSVAAQLSTAGMQNSDFEFEGKFLFTSSYIGPIVFRYSADLQLPTWYDELLREAISARIAIELCETLTQSPAKAQMIMSHYNEIVEKAIRVNAIEAGSTEPDTQDVKTNKRPALERQPPPRPQPQQG